MSTDTPEVAAARSEVERCRARLLETVGELQAKLNPQEFAQKAWQETMENLKQKGADLAEDAVDTVRARPLASAGVITAVAMFLAREPLMDLAGKLVDGAKTSRSKRKRKATQEKKTESVG